MTLNNTDNIDTRRIAIYIRVSTKKQYEEGCSLEVQENQCRKFVYKMGYTEDDITLMVENQVLIPTGRIY